MCEDQTPRYKVLVRLVEVVVVVVAAEGVASAFATSTLLRNRSIAD